MKATNYYCKHIIYLSLLILLLEFNIKAQDFISEIINPDKKYNVEHLVVLALSQKKEHLVLLQKNYQI